VQLDGARGPLTAQQSKAVLARLATSGEETGIFERHLALEGEIAGSPLVVGNRVALLKDGPATYSAMFQAIAAARDHIHMETYIIEDDEVGRKFADALIAKRAQGVRVALIYDGLGSLGTPGAFFKRLTEAGVDVAEFNTVNPNHRDHRKILIIDGKTAFVGGVNISGVYSKGGSSRSSPDSADAMRWRDTHLRIEGPVVAEFQKLFLATWDKQKGEPLSARDRIRAGQPGRESSARWRARPTSPTASSTRPPIRDRERGDRRVPHQRVFRAGSAADGRAHGRRAPGVNVKLVLPAKTDSWIVFHAGRAHFEERLEAGVKIYARRDAMRHSKTAVIDGVWSTVGSSNLDWRSFLPKEEVVAIVLGQEFGAQMQSMFEADIEASDLITAQSWSHRPLSNHVQEIAAQVWSYWL
jgi:cardiolipin synthase